MSGANFNSIGGQLAKNTDSAGASLTSRMNNNFESTSPTHIMDVMRQMNNRSLAVNLESSVAKMIADMLKGVVPKIG